jgi:hypothetical protein
VPESELQARREKSPIRSPSLLPLVLIVALAIGAGIYWLATATDTNKIFGPMIAAQSGDR